MSASQPIVLLDNVFRTYQLGGVALHALAGISLTFEPGEYVSIMGPSGCGKSTMLNLLGCLDRPSDGRYLLGGRDVTHMDDDELSEFRGTQLGFIFQSYNLIQQLSVLENIEVPLFYRGIPPVESRERAVLLAEKVGLGQRLHHRPMELSGGQQQRVGIARALANEPILLLADEPTGNLDSRSGSEILELFDELNGQGRTIILVTHDPEICNRSHRTVRLRDGRVEEDTRRV